MLDKGYMTLDGAAKLVGDGWAQGGMAYDIRGTHMGAEDGGVVNFCAEGAIRRAWFNIEGAAFPSDHGDIGSGDLGAWRAFKAFYQAIFDRAPIGSLMDICEAISCWNDNPHRERSDVLAAFERARAIIANGELGA